jgi:wyosine [tRNA(Phe)-imidazoG37] synthetase (radical SAM superfamily)
VKYLYGPVPSRRLGSSLGVDLTPRKTCSFDCIYCQLGKTTHKTAERREYVPVREVLAEVRDYMESGGKCDYITLSGSGEPTLNSGIKQAIKGIKSLTDIPVAAITNSSLLPDRQVREEIKEADVVLPSLDAVTQRMFETINRPCSGLKISEIMEGLIKFTRKFTGEVWLEIMLVDGLNNDASEIESMSKVMDLINPDKIQLNTVVRPASEEYAQHLLAENMREIAGILDAEIIADYDRLPATAYNGDVRESISNMLERRPCTIRELSSTLKLNENEVLKYLQVLIGEGRVKPVVKDGLKYFTGFLG